MRLWAILVTLTLTAPLVTAAPRGVLGKTCRIDFTSTLVLARSCANSIHESQPILDRIGDFCVADYLAELDKVHPVRYSTRFSLRLHRTSSCLPTSDNHGERMLSASATERASASFMTSDGTQIGKRWSGQYRTWDESEPTDNSV